MVWAIEEKEEFFTSQLPTLKLPSNPHKRLQHLAGRFLIKQMHPDFPFEKLVSDPGSKPYLSNHSFQFSISHSGDMAAAIINKEKNVGIDIEMITDKANRIARKFMHESEFYLISNNNQTESSYHYSLYWSIKETVFKWYGHGQVDFREDIQIKAIRSYDQVNIAECFFRKTNQILLVNFLRMNNMVLSWMM